MSRTQEHIETAAHTLSAALLARDLETGRHSRRVAHLAVRLGRSLVSPGDLRTLYLGAILHDVGKLRTPDAVLCSTQRLTDEEWEAMRRHPVDGAAILTSLDFPESIIRIVEQHHERTDGAGYPYAIPGKDICLGARIVAVTDAYDAITRDRSYRKGEAHEVALHELTQSAGTQFDVAIVDLFIRLFRKPLKTF